MQPAAIPASCSWHAAADAELIAGAHRPVAVEDDVHHLLALHGAALLVAQFGHDPSSVGCDDITGGRVGVLAVDAEHDPSRLIAQPQAGGLPGRHGPRV